MPRHFGEKRDPSFGSWNAEETEPDFSKAKPRVHRPSESESPEDRLIAEIDSQKRKKKHGQEVEMNRGPKTPDTMIVDDLLEQELRDAEQMSAAARYEKSMDPRKDADKNLQVSQREILTPKERSDISLGKDQKSSARYGKRHESQSQAKEQAEIRKRKGKKRV